MKSPQPKSQSDDTPPPPSLVRPSPATVVNPSPSGRKEPNTKVKAKSSDEAAKKKIKTAEHVVDIIPAGVLKAEEDAKMRAIEQSETDNTASETSGSESDSSAVVAKEESSASSSSDEDGKEDRVEEMIAPPPPALRSSAAVVLPMPAPATTVEPPLSSEERENDIDLLGPSEDDNLIENEEEVPRPATLEAAQDLPAPPSLQTSPGIALSAIVPVPVDAGQDSLVKPAPESMEATLALTSLERSSEGVSTEPGSNKPSQEAPAPSTQENSHQAQTSSISEQEAPMTISEETGLTPMQQAMRILEEGDRLVASVSEARTPTERPEAKRVASSTAIDVDALMDEYYASHPPPTEFFRSESQQVAVNAVLEPDAKEQNSKALTAEAAKIMSEDDEKNIKSTNSAATVELTDEELPAAIPTVLRRQSSSTPGAFHAGGRSSGVIPPESLRVSSGHSRASQGSGDSRHSRDSVAGGVSVEDSCTTLVSATLVQSHDSDTELASFRDSGNNLLPIAASHVEPMWWKRRFAYCTFAFAFLAIAVIALGVSMALIVNKSESVYMPMTPPTDTESPVVSPTTSPPAAATPTPAPVEVNSRGSHHSVMWGKVSTCEDPAFFSDYNLDLRCGGKLEVVYQENAECSQVDDSKASCELLVTKESTITDDGFYYQEALGYVIFSCEGETHTDLTGTALLPDMPLNNCTNVTPADGSNRRQLIQQSSATVYQGSSFQATRARAIQEAVSKGGGSAFMSIGRFCRETSQTEWDFWHELYVCERGKRLITTALGALYDGEPPDIVKIFRNGEGNGGGRRHRRLAQERNGGVRQRRLQIDFFDLLWQYADLNSYCYNFNTCSGDESGCNTQIGEVGISDSDPRESCHRDSNDQPSLDVMKEIMKDSFDPSKFIDRLTSNLEA